MGSSALSVYLSIKEKEEKERGMMLVKSNMVLSIVPKLPEKFNGQTNTIDIPVSLIVASSSRELSTAT